MLLAARTPEAVGYAAVLVLGALAGLVGRLVLRPGRRMDLSATVLCGIAGSVIGFAVLRYVPTLTGRGFPWLRLILAAVIGTLAVMATGQLVRMRWERTHPDLVHADDVRALIAAGESDRVEFKSTARWNTHTGGRDERLELVIAKTVAAFLNADGGTLLIGVDDAGEVVGVELDYQLVRQGDRDRYELWLHDLLGGCLGTTVLSRLRFRFPRADGHDLCRIDVAPAPAPVFLSPPKGRRAADFYLRVGNSTRLLLSDEVLDYAATRWPNRPLTRLLRPLARPGRHLGTPLEEDRRPADSE